MSVFLVIYPWNMNFWPTTVTQMQTVQTPRGRSIAPVKQVMLEMVQRVLVCISFIMKEKNPRSIY